MSIGVVGFSSSPLYLAPVNNRSLTYIGMGDALGQGDNNETTLGFCCKENSIDTLSTATIFKSPFVTFKVS